MRATQSVGLMLLAGCLVMGSTIGVAAERGLTPGGVEKAVVTVPGNQAWVNTGFRLRPQDRVTITATGTVWFSGDYPATGVDPTGWDVNTYEADWPDDYGWGFDPLPAANHAALIGNVGSEVAYVGTRLVFWGADGFLYLGINDCSFTGPFYNTGQFNAVVTVERGVITEKPKEEGKAGLDGPQPLLLGKKQ